MEEKTMSTLRMAVCKEADELAEKAKSKGLSHEDYDLLKDLTSIEKNLNRIEEHDMTYEGMDMGHSQRTMRGVYYVDGDYSNANRDMYDRGQMGGSYGRYYDRYQEYPRWNDWSHSMNNGPQDMISKLRMMADETTDAKVKAAIFEALGKLENK